MYGLVGRRIDNYHIDALLGEGGMGAVYRAHDVNLKRTVAVKVMHGHLARQQPFQQRFLQEAQAAARLEHPLIVNVHDFGNQQDLLFMVMEFVPGGNLGSYMRRLRQQGKVVQLQEMLYLLAQVANALDYAHRHDVVHRDVKPDNILLKRLDAPDRPGEPPLRVIVTDFGLAKLADGDVHTVTNTFMGTLPYMSPEQVLGKELDGRSDLYSLGVILYHLATGRLPLDITSPTDAVNKHLHETPPQPQSVKPELPVKVAAITWKAIAKDPNERFQTGAQMALALRQVAAKLTPEDVTRFAPPETVASLVTEPWLANREEPPSPERETDPWAGGAFASPKPGAAKRPVPPKAVEVYGVDGQLSVIVNPGEVMVAPGQQIAMRVELFNEGAQVTHVRLRLDGLASAWYYLPQEPIQLMPGANATLPLRLHPPRDSSAHAGRHRFHLMVIKVSGGATIASVAAALAIEPFTAFDVDMQPSYPAHGDTVRILVHNQGNAKTVFTLAGRDPANTVRIESRQEQVMVSPGEKETIAVTVRAGKRPLLGAKQTLPFQVAVSSSDGVVRQQAGQLRVPPRIPRWGIPLLLLLLLVLGFAPVAFLFDQMRQDNVEATRVAQANIQTAEAITQQAMAAAAAAETATAGTATADALADDDDDGLSNQQELAEYSTDPRNPDSDNDGLTDGEEIEAGTDPKYHDTDEDGIPDGDDPAPLEPDGTGTTTAPPIEPPDNRPAESDNGLVVETSGRLAFVSNRNGSDAIYVMDLRSPGAAQPVTQPQPGQRHWWPAWCGANRVVFEYGNDGAGQQEVGMVDLASGALEFLTNGSRPSGSRMNGIPSCSPDRETLVLSTLAQNSGTNNEFRIGLLPVANGAGVFSLLGDGYPLGGNVSWSPDGSAVVFMHYPFYRDRNRDPIFEIYRVDLDQPTTFRNLTESYAGSGKYPDWSPTGDQIAFSCRSPGSNPIWALCLTPSDRAQVTPVLTNLHQGDELGPHAVTPSWSPDGRWIAFASDQDGDWDIYVYSLETETVTNLTNSWPSDEMHPEWGP